MLELFRRHLRPLPGQAARIEHCTLSGLRYRPGTRSVLQYTARLAASGRTLEQSLWMTGVIRPPGGSGEDRLRRVSRRLGADPGVERASATSLFEPVAFIPEIGMLVQVFPYDRRLPTLPALVGGPPPELEPLLLDRTGPGDWQAEKWCSEPVRYRPGLGAVLRHSVVARERPTGKRRRRSFYVKVYPNGQAEHAYQSLEALTNETGAGRYGFDVPRPVAHHAGLRVLVVEEVPGTPLDRIIVEGAGTTEAARTVARALAAFSQSDAAPTRSFSPENELAALERAVRLLCWGRPDLSLRLERIVRSIAAGLEEVPSGPTHRDLKPDHVLLDHGRPALVDLDSFGAADPVIDPATLLARLTSLPLQLPVSRGRTRAAARAFADEYFARVPTAWRARLPVHYAGALLELAASMFRRQQPGWPDKIAVLVGQADAALNGRVR